MALDRTEAFMNGWHAHRLGMSNEFNPYSESHQSFSYNQWLSGWCRRFGAVKHGEHVKLAKRDEELGH